MEAKVLDKHVSLLKREVREMNSLIIIPIDLEPDKAIKLTGRPITKMSNPLESLNQALCDI